LGAAYLAGLAIGFWGDTNEIEKYWAAEKNFEPVMKNEERQKKIYQWAKAIKAAQAWTAG
jgi:glycerol kinase